jgi:hypothetical protein
MIIDQETDANDQDSLLEDDLLQILKAAGIESAPIDPQSMIALRQLVAEKREQESESNRDFASMGASAASSDLSYGRDEPKPKLLSSTAKASSLKLPPPASLSAHPMGTSLSSPLAVSSTKQGSWNPPLSTDKDPTIANNNPISDSTSALLFEQLQHQTALMMQLQQQVQALHQKVDYLQQQQQQEKSRGHPATSPAESSIYSDGERSFTFARTRIYMRPSMSEEESPASSPSSRQQRHQQEDFQRRIKTRRYVMAGGAHDDTPAAQSEPDAGAEDPNQPHEGAAARQVQQQGPLQARQVPLPVRVVLFPFHLVVRYWQFEYQVLQALWRMGRREVRPLDGGVLMQLFFVSLVVAKSSRDPEKQQLLISIVIMGFLYHMKVLPFLYKFFVKNNVPLRIWKGMDPEGTDDVYRNAGANAAAENQGNPADQPAIPGQPQPPGRPNANQQAEGNGWWADTFIMGGIAAPNNDNNAEGGGAGNPVTRFLWDVIYLFGSFFFSIFPMWRPEQRPRQVPPAAAEEGEEQGQQEDVGGNHRPNDGGQIPQVQPPRDAMEPADSDDDEEDDE